MKLSRLCTLAAAGTLWGTGCASYGAHLSAAPTAPQKTEIRLNADGILIDRGFGAQPFPNLEFGWRRGLSDNLDIGVRINAVGAEVNTRWRVARGRTAQLSIVPALGVGFVPVTNADTGLIHVVVGARLLSGFNLTSETELTLGLVSLNQIQFELVKGQSPKFVTLPGLSIGYRFPVGNVALHPEVNVVVPYDTERREWLPPIGQAGISFIFGG